MQDASHYDNFCGIIKDVTVLGTDKKPVWERRTERLRIYTDYQNGDYPNMFKVETD